MTTTEAINQLKESYENVNSTLYNMGVTTPHRREKMLEIWLTDVISKDDIPAILYYDWRELLEDWEQSHNEYGIYTHHGADYAYWSTHDMAEGAMSWEISPAEAFLFYGVRARKK